MVRQRASAGGRRNVVQTAHDLRRISLLTDTPDALSSLAKARFYRQIGVYRSPLLALSLPSIAVDNYSHLYCRSRAAVIWLHSG
ncbi:hypothetical protein M9623_18080 [Salmonella sp. SC1]|nr:hypothetical protein [Salmonella enterica]MDJ4523819.1 hypothetical protein [Salmonella enterica]MDJ4536947.1 hypothetical protein [Salmonella enterica]MDJ4801888.1 hypothetical protein [Salmonella enterica]MDJ4996997.1 hypothetical protein [Salmonella enterica]